MTSNQKDKTPASPVSWETVKELFTQVLPLNPYERESMLAKQADPRVSEQVRALLRSHEDSPDYLEKSPATRSPQNALKRPDDFPVPQIVGDFELLEKLGQGGIATVYRARQISLSRTVALKIAQDGDNEARTIAQLDHDHIVSVFSETRDVATKLRFICMQYVPGQTMDRLLVPLAKDVRRPDYFGVAIQIARALAHAHERKLVHSDIKPANILIHPEGRAYLFDFNVSRSQDATVLENTNPLGGTFEYMAPEQWDLYFENASSRQLGRLGPQTDLFSLGLVLKEWFAHGGYLDDPNSELTGLLDRCTQLVPETRLASAEELARGLEGCRDLVQIQNAMPLPGFLARSAQRHPFWTLTLGGFVIQFVASLVSVAYNQANIIKRLDLPQQHAFDLLSVTYNPICFVIGMTLWGMGIHPLVRYLRRNGRSESAASARARVLRLPKWTFWLSFGSWMPGGLLFPAVLHWGYGPLPLAAAEHLFVSFLLSCLIALSYGILYADWLTIRSIYPRFWDVQESIRETASRELAPALKRLRVCQMSVVGVPMIAAILAIAVGPTELTPARYQAFGALVSLLIFLGVLGSYIAVKASASLMETFYALTRRRD